MSIIYKDQRDDKLFNIFTALLNSNNPVWIARYGGSDSDVYQMIIKTKKIYIQHINYIRKYNGFFCKDANTISSVVQKSIEDYSTSLNNADLITICCAHYIDTFITKNFNPFVDTPITTYKFIESFEPFFKSFQIWGENKKILVISPFSKTIQYQTQSERLDKILANKFKFPNCSFITYQTPITYNTDDSISEYFKNVTKEYNNWMELSQKMCEEINDLEYDIAFITAGIYSMNFGNFIKQQGKKAIYIGGMLNVLFNIYGSRYDNKFFNNLVNKEYQVEVMDDFNDLIDNKSLFVKNEVLGAYMRMKAEN